MIGAARGDSRAWVSQADITALLEAFRRLERLKSEDPSTALHRLHGELASGHIAAGPCSAPSARDAEEHVLVDVPADVMAALRAMGRCAAVDARGRPICVEAATTALQLYRVLLEQFELLFHVDLPRSLDWSPAATLVKAQAAFPGDAERLNRALQTIGKAVDDLKRPGIFFPSTDASIVGKLLLGARELEVGLAESVGRRLQFEDVPAALVRFRQDASCPMPVKPGQIPKAPSPECSRVVIQHMRLFAARLAEAVVQDALAQVPYAKRQSVAKSLDKGSDRYSSEPFFNLSKFRLAWQEDARHFWTLVGNGNLKAFADAGGRAGLHLGLSSETHWPGTRERIQDDLTKTTRELSRLSEAHAREPNVLTKDFLNVAAQEANPAFDLLHIQARQRFGKAPRAAPCDRVFSVTALARALASLQKRNFTRALSWIDLEQNDMKAVPLAEDLRALVQALETFRRESRTSSSQFKMELWLDVGDRKLPLTVSKQEDAGMFDAVLWMLCEGKTLKTASRLQGRWSLRGKVVKGSEFFLDLE